MPAPWLATALRAAGLLVVEQPGWQSRGTGGSFTPTGVLCHHTAGPATGDLPSLRIVRDGRSDLPGPLSQLMLSRSGVFHVIAAGRANHAGAGAASWVPNNDGNRYLIGIEAESSGTRDDWTAAQRANYPRGVAALCLWMGVGPGHVLGHKEWAPRRKVDPAFWDMAQFRASVGRWLANDGLTELARPAPTTPAPAPSSREDDPAMRIDIRPNDNGEFYETVVLDGGNTAYVAQSHLLLASERGKTRFVVTARNGTGAEKALYGWDYTLPTHGVVAIGPLDPATRLLIIEGKVSDAGVRPAATVLLKAA